jgi:hypothetical protein
MGMLKGSFIEQGKGNLQGFAKLLKEMQLLPIVIIKIRLRIIP